MCVIIAKRKGDKVDRGYLEHMMIRGANSNRDGCGFALKKDGSNEIIFSKGYQGLNAAQGLIAFLKAYEIEEGDEFMFHARIGTSGRRDEYNTHPFVLGELATEDNESKLTITDLHLTRPCFAHNGVFYEYSDYKSRWNDTFHFGDQFLSQPEVVANLIKLDEDAINLMYKSDFDYSKVSIMFPENEIPMKLVGAFSTDKKGLWYSNRMWEYGDTYRNVGGVETFGSNFDSCSLPNRSAKLLTENISTENIGGFDADVELVFEEEEKAQPNSGRNYYNNVAYWEEEWEEEERKIQSLKQKKTKTELESMPPSYLDIELTDKNCMELYLIAKEDVGSVKKDKVYQVNDIGHSSNTYWVSEFGYESSSVLRNAVFLNNYFNFLPAETYVNKYRDYRYLCSKIEPSKNRAKNIKKLLNRNLMKINRTSKIRGLLDVSTVSLVEYYNQKLLPLLVNENPIVVVEEAGYPFIEN